uniref:Uncharacterized protein n=1 Tax=Anguilla anguilla TaxID=7936 RepID=A0A0E9WJJ0_ANGAN
MNHVPPTHNCDVVITGAEFFFFFMCLKDGRRHFAWRAFISSSCTLRSFPPFCTNSHVVSMIRANNVLYCMIMTLPGVPIFHTEIIAVTGQSGFQAGDCSLIFMIVPFL